MLPPAVTLPVVDCEGVVKMTYSGDVPRAAGQGARKKGVELVYEVGDDDSYKVLWESGDWGWIWGRDLGGTLGGDLTLLDLGLGPVPESISKQLNRCNSDNASRSTSEVARNSLKDYLLTKTWVFSRMTSSWRQPEKY